MEACKKNETRLVAKGYVQQPSVDFNETFAPMTHIKTIIMVLAIVAQLELQVYQQDVKSTFLNGELEQEVYVEQPPGYELKGKEEKVLEAEEGFIWP